MAPASKEELEAERQCWEHRRDVEELSDRVLVLSAKIQAAHDRIDEIGRQRTEERAKAEAIANERKTSTQTKMWVATALVLPLVIELAKLWWSTK
jgi:hypothetical protein